MPDVEVLKVVLNGGSFGLLAILVVWALFYGAPMLRDLGLKHEDTMQKQAADAKAEREKLAAECRQEREMRDERFERIVAEIVRGKQCLKQ